MSVTCYLLIHDVGAVVDIELVRAALARAGLGGDTDVGEGEGHTLVRGRAESQRAVHVKAVPMPRREADDAGRVRHLDLTVTVIFHEIWKKTVGEGLSWTIHADGFNGIHYELIPYVVSWIFFGGGGDGQRYNWPFLINKEMSNIRMGQHFKQIVRVMNEIHCI